MILLDNICLNLKKCLFLRKRSIDEKFLRLDRNRAQAIFYFNPKMKCTLLTWYWVLQHIRFRQVNVNVWHDIFKNNNKMNVLFARFSGV